MEEISIPGSVEIIDEAEANFSGYLKNLGMSKETDILILPSRNHFYYDSDDLKGVKTLVNLRELNLIKHLDSFLNTLANILPHNANFIGCFSDSASENDRNSFNLHTRLYSRLINWLDAKTDNIMNKSMVSELLERKGFRTVDMKEMNGLTYFTCKVSFKQEKRA